VRRSAQLAADVSHVSLTIGEDLWRELLRAALPIRLAEGNVELAATARRLLVQSGVPGRVAGLLADGPAPAAVRTASERAVAAWRRRRAAVARRLGAWVRVEGRWHVALDRVGTDVRYGRQSVAADATVTGVAEGVVLLVQERVEFPFRIERSVQASVALERLRWDADQDAVIGSVGDLALHLGDGAVANLFARLGEALLAPRLDALNPVPLVRRQAVERLLAGVAGPMRVDLGVEDLDLVVQDGEATLRVLLGFHQARLAAS
jgi:hypothetical protein